MSIENVEMVVGGELADLPRRTSPAEFHLPDEHLTIIEAKPDWRIVDFAELWRYRELLQTLVWRDVQVRYKQTVLGALWALIQPLTQMIVFTIFFGRMAEVPGSRGAIAYPLFAFAGLLPWTFFANAVASSSMSVVANQNLVSKVYFPRLFVPASAIGVGLVDFAVGSLLMFVLLGIFPHPATQLAGVAVLPLIVLGLVAAAFGTGVLISALTVAYRDFRHVVPFMVQLWMFATPTVFMDTSSMGNRWHAILPLNPAFGFILNFRNALCGMPLDWYALTVSWAVTIAIVLVGCVYFHRVEKTFADII